MSPNEELVSCLQLESSEGVPLDSLRDENHGTYCGE